MAGPRLNHQILIAIALAVVAGLTVGETATFAGLPLHGMVDFVGTLFVSALKMLIVPLVISSLIVGAASGRSAQMLGRLGLRTITFFLVTTIPAVLMGMALVGIVRPGIVDGRPAGDLLALNGLSADLAEEIADKGFGAMLDVFLSIIPTSVVGAAASEDLLGLVFFAALFGHFMGRLAPAYADPLFRFWSGVAEVMMRMTEWVMLCAPIGVFCLVTRAVAKTGIDAAAPLVMFAAVVLTALAGHALITLPLLLRLVGRVSPLALYRAVTPAFLTALATSSAAAALPVSLACLRQRANVSTRVSSFVLPLAAGLNMNGTALYHAAAAIFLAQTYGLDLDVAAQLTILSLAVVTSIGVPGLPSASLVAVAIMLSAIGLPNEATGVLLVFDRLIEMVRTGINVLGDTACAVIIARLEGEDRILAGNAARDAGA